MDMKTTPPHLGESEILKLIDGDGAAGELSALAIHTEGCAACAERVDTLRSEGERVRVALSAVQLPPGFPTAEQLMWRAQTGRGAARMRPAAGRRAHGWMRAAAVVLILLLPVALVRPIRAAVVEWAQRGWAVITGVGDRTPVEAPRGTPADVPGRSFRIYFTPTGDVVELTITSRQRQGELLVQPAAGAEGSLEIVGGGSESPLVTPSGVVVRNGAESNAGYVLRVPEGVTTVRVRIGEEPAVVLRRAELGEGRHIGIVR